MRRTRTLVTSRIPKMAAVALAVLALAAACARKPAPAPPSPSNAGLRKSVPFKSVVEQFKDPDMIYAPFIFWFWDEPLDPAKMAEMARVMMSQGFDPGYAHARKSMVGTPDLPADDWLGDQWFEAFGAALSEAEKGRGYLGYCDEYWWPSFQAYGRIVAARPELRAQSLKWQAIDVKGGAETTVPASFFAVAVERDQPVAADARPAPASKSADRIPHVPAVIRSRTLRTIGAGAPFAWKAPAGADWRVYAFNLYHHPGADGSTVNYIDARLAPAFIETALEPYARRLGDKLGRSVPGDFIDNEGDYGWGLAWSGTLDERYRERYGRDIRLWLPLSVDRDVEGAYAKARWEWFDLVSDIYAETFRAVTDWHEKRGMSTTAHFWEEGIQPQVNAVGDHLKMLRSLTMAGQDCLGRKPLRVHDFKEIESVAEFQGSRAATELMGAGAFEGTPWGTFNPVFLKQAANAVTAWGMSHVIPHGVFSTRKLTGNPWPPDWYSENPMFPYLHLWTDFVRRASLVNSQGRTVPDVLLWNPIESAWVQADADILDIEMWKFSDTHPGGRRINEIERVYATAIDDLTAARVEFMVGDRFYLKQMEVKEGRLVRGDLSFRTVVLPAVDIMPLAAARKVVEFARSGGRVYALAALPTASAENGLGDPKMKRLMEELRASPSFGEAGEGGLKPLLDRPAPGLESPVRFVSGVFPMLQHRRRIDGRDFFWLVNNSEEWQACEVEIDGVRGAASIWDCETGRVRPIASASDAKGSRLALVFKPLEAYWVVFDKDEGLAPPGPRERVPEVEVVSAVRGPWTVRFDAAVQSVMEFPLTPPAAFKAGIEKPLEDWKAWGLEKFSGLLEYTKTVTVADPAPDLRLDLGRVCHAAEVWVNGRSCGARLWGPYVFEVGPALKPGPNEIRIRVANLINNTYGEPAASGLLGPVRLVRLR
jgi:hypothetical protein